MNSLAASANDDAPSAGRQVAAPSGPGWILISLAVLCAAIIVVPTVGISALLLRDGFSPMAVIWQLLSGMNLFMLSLVLPSLLLALMAAVFLIAFVMRAAWGPAAVSMLALSWTVSATVSRIVTPVLAMHGGLPALTWLGTIPGLAAPFVLTLGLIGFLTTGERPRGWFTRRGMGWSR